MGRVISDLPSFSETVANGDLLVCHNVSKAVNTRDEKLPVEKLVADMVHSQRNPFTFAQGMMITKTGVTNNVATNIADLTRSGAGGFISGAVLAGVEVSGSGVISSALYAVVWAWSSETATVLASQLFNMSSLTMTVDSNPTDARVRFAVTQVNSSAVACTVRLSVFPISAWWDQPMTLTAL